MVVHKFYDWDPRVRRYAESLVKQGIEVDILCPRGDGVKAPLGCQRPHGIRVFAIPLRRGGQRRSNYLFEYGVATILFSLLLLALHIRRRYDIVHVHNMPDFLVLTAVIPKLLGAKVILDIHDPMPEFYMSKYSATPSSLMLRLLRAQEILSTRLANRVVTANRNFKRRIVERGVPDSKVTVVNNVANSEVFDRHRYAKDARPRGGFTLVYPGTIAPRYGLEVAIRALPLLVGKIPGVRLVIMGPPAPHEDELRAVARELCVSALVEFRGHVPIEEVPAHLIRADVGIYTALRDPHMDIATPTKVLEYATIGIPIVSARLKVVEDLFPESAVLYFDPGDPAQFARCILHLHANPDLGRRLTREADRVFVSKHSWDREFRTYMAMLGALRPQLGKDKSVPFRAAGNSGQTSSRNELEVTNQ